MIFVCIERKGQEQLRGPSWAERRVQAQAPKDQDAEMEAQMTASFLLQHLPTGARPPSARAECGEVCEQQGGDARHKSARCLPSAFTASIRSSALPATNEIGRFVMYVSLSEVCEGRVSVPHLPLRAHAGGFAEARIFGAARCARVCVPPCTVPTHFAAEHAQRDVFCYDDFKTEPAKPHSTSCMHGSEAGHVCQQIARAGGDDGLCFNWCKVEALPIRCVVKILKTDGHLVEC